MSHLERVTPQAIRAELRRLGFQESDPYGRGGATWINPADPHGPAILVPRESDQDRPGYGELLDSAVERLAWVLETAKSETIDRLTEPGDRFELRLVDRATVGGRLPVVFAVDVIHGFLQVLRAGARAEFIGTQAFYGPSYPESVRAALEWIDLLAPAEGSFRLIAASAVEAQLPLDRAAAVPDQSRRALAATVRGLHTAASITEEEAPDPEELLPAIHEGLSADLLGGIERISRKAPQMSVEFNVRWDASLPTVDAPTVGVSLDQEQLRRIPPLVKRLREQEPEEYRVITGWVRTAKADELARAGHPSGLVMVEARIEKSMRTVLIELSAELFEQIRPGVSHLIAKGNLRKISNRWHLTDPHDIVIRDAP